MSARNNDDNIERYTYDGITFPQYLTGGVSDDAPLWIDRRSLTRDGQSKRAEIK